MFLRCLVMLLLFDTYAFESAQTEKQYRVWFLYINLASFHKMLISSQAMMYPTRMIDTVLEHLKVIILVFESHRDIPVSLGNTWSTFVDLNVDQNA